MSSDHHNLGLELGLGSQDHHHGESRERLTTSVKYDHLRPTDLTLGPISPSGHRRQQAGRASLENSADTNMLHRQASSLSAASSFSNSSGNISAKRDREVISGEEVETNPAPRVIGGAISDPNQLIMEDDHDHGSPRKKLRLTKQQSNLLEDSFKEHATLNPKQKQDLARRLNLRPRQVEVWFQNRRARTKLKQTEADYEQWKKCCEALTEENKRLQKELQELKSLSLLTAPFYMPFSSSAAAATAPPANLTICPSCERRGGGESTTRLLIKPKATHFISNSYTTSTQHPSEAAC